VPNAGMVPKFLVPLCGVDPRPRSRPQSSFGSTGYGKLLSGVV
jgi:hypothetical protein